METPECPIPQVPDNPVPNKPCRRVGTFTFGLALVISGAVMLASMFFPHADFTLAVKLSPLLLVSLGVEVLLASRGGGRVRYDWVGMLLCCIVVCTALVFFGMAWCILHTDGSFVGFCY